MRRNERKSHAAHRTNNPFSRPKRLRRGLQPEESQRSYSKWTTSRHADAGETGESHRQHHTKESLL